MSNVNPVTRRMLLAKAGFLGATAGLWTQALAQCGFRAGAEAGG